MYLGPEDRRLATTLQQMYGLDSLAALIHPQGGHDP